MSCLYLVVPHMNPVQCVTLHRFKQNTTQPVQGLKSGLAVVYIYPVEPNLCDETAVTDSILGEYMVDEKTSVY